MKKRISVLVLAVLLVATLFAACGGNNESYSNITAQSNPYSKGSQSIEIVASSSLGNEPQAKFKQTISPSDIELGGALEGKTVTKVVFNDETSITVTLDGDAQVAGGEGIYGTITVKQSGMESEGSSTCTVNVRAPEICVVSFSKSYKKKGEVTVYTINAKLDLPVGAFTESATAENVTLANGITGDLSVEVSDGLLVLTVKDCSVDKPAINIKPAATTFDKEITVQLIFGGSDVI